jgi:hypothetical protein
MAKSFSGAKDVLDYIKNSTIETVELGEPVPTAYFAYDPRTSNVHMKILTSYEEAGKTEAEMAKIIKQYNLNYCIVVMTGKLSYETVVANNLLGIPQDPNMILYPQDESIIIAYVNKNSTSVELLQYHKESKDRIVFRPPIKFLDFTMDSVISNMCETLFQQDWH